MPAWAVGSAGAIASFPVIPGVERLTIFGENDKSDANDRAVAECRARREGVGRVFRIKPDEGCCDLNDAWQALPQAPYEERAAIFEAICNRFWPRAKIVPLQEGPSVLDALKRIGYQGFNV